MSSKEGGAHQQPLNPASSAAEEVVIDLNTSKGSAKGAQQAASSSTAKVNRPEFEAQSPWVKFRAGTVTWKTLALFSTIGCSILAYYALEKQRKSEQLRKTHTKTVSGKAKIGGPWTLTSSTTGKLTSSSDFHGKFVLVYFGFTFCPDVCPDELDKISEAIESLGSLKQYVKPIFISIDPERDTPERIREYLKDFHPTFEGFTGTVEECKEVAKLYRVYYSKTEETEGGDYLVDHSIISYLVDPNGDFLEFYGKQVSAADMCLRLTSLVNSYLRQLQKANQKA